MHSVLGWVSLLRCWKLWLKCPLQLPYLFSDPVLDIIAFPMWRVAKDCVFQGNFKAKEVDMTGKTVVITGPSRGGILAILGSLRSQKPIPTLSRLV